MDIDSSSEHLLSFLHTCTGEVQRCLMNTNIKAIISQVNAIGGEKQYK